MNGDNPSGAVNQQERPGFEQWVVGFVDGEGCFSISVVRNPGLRLGWQVQHEFSVTQAAPSRTALEEHIEFFGCGSIIENSRRDNHRYRLMRYAVKRRSNLRGLDHPVLRRTPTENCQAERLRVLLRSDLDDERRSTSDPRGFDRNRSNHRENESQAAISIPGILRGHTPATSIRRSR